MSRRFVLLNAGLVVVALVSGAYIVNQLRTPAPAVSRRSPPPSPPAAAVDPPAAEPASSFNMVATRNLFSPTRTEAPPVASASPTAAPQLPRPNLYGIILRDGAPVAYLEDPASKRVGGYRVGDAVGGGTLKRIGADHVVLNRPEGDISVRLRDPSKPRPAAPPAAGPTPPATAGAPVAPGVPPVAAGPQPPQPTSPTLTRPQLPTTPVLPRRPLPPNLLRRLPPSATDAPAQQ